VVGAGVAGLSAANRLSRAGLHVEVFEASDGVGGRAPTDPRRRVSTRPGNTAPRGGALDRVGDPRREPLAVPLILAAPSVVCGTWPLWRRTPRVRPSDLCDASGHSTTCRSPGAGPARVCPDRGGPSAPTVLQRVGDMTTSSRFVDLMLRMFARGSC
jgi:hypothetical protein